MSDKAFFDTNLFIYVYDGRDPSKQRRAVDLLVRAWAEGTLVVSYQVIQEFFNFALRKAEVKMTPSDAQRMLVDVFRPLHLVPPSLALIGSAIEIADRFRLSWYDSLIVAAAQHGGCTRLYSEDLQHGQRFGPVEVIDPFR